MSADQSPIARPAPPVGLPAEITATRIVAIIRAESTRRVRAAVEQLVIAGVSCVEIALATPGAMSEIAALAGAFGADACIGVGTVLTPAQAADCIAAGATFLVAPSTVPDVVETARQAGVPCLPGALTPSEIVAAWASGAAAVTLFPAWLGGPRYVREVRGPLPDIPLVPTGGISVDDIPEYLSAGAIAVGLGSSLFGDALRDGDLDSLRQRAEHVVRAVRISRAGRPV